MHPQNFLLLALTALCLGHFGDTLLGGLFSSEKQQPQQNGLQMKAPIFLNGTEYRFQYDAQIASGLIGQDEPDKAEAQQKAITRLKCLARITFVSGQHAQLCLERCRAGQLNEPVKDAQQCQPMAMFEPTEIPAEQQRQLELMCQFDYAEGVIERVLFDQNDASWSRNIKRGVLQMIQLNLSQKNAAGMRQEEEDQQQHENKENAQENDQDVAKDSMLSKSFTIPEINVEGQCQTTYSINAANPLQMYTGDDKSTTMPCSSFNVTKSINFKQCTRMADVAYGQQSQEEQEQERPSLNWPNSNVSYSQKVDRTTVLRYVLKCGDEQLKQSGQNQQQEEEQELRQNSCQLERTELLSQYVYKSTKTENSGQYGAAIHTVVAAELRLLSVQPQQQEQQKVPSTQSFGNDPQTLMYSNKLEMYRKRFYMFGDDGFAGTGTSPFHLVPKVEQAQQALRKLVQAIQNDQEGIQPQQAIQQQRLVQMLRMSTQMELNQIQQKTENQQDSENATQIFVNALASCGTRNCVTYLSDKIMNEEIPSSKCTVAFSSLQNVPAPSDAIVETVLQLCQSPKVESDWAFKQTCWLTLGAMVNQLCQHKTTQKAAQQSDVQEQCPSNKKEQYKQAFLAQFEKSQSIYENVLALSALGNAGIDTSIGRLEQIIKEGREQRVVRVKAIDALRRLRTLLPREIQQILLPIYQNTGEQTEVRTAAFALLMDTLPGHHVIDQCAFTMGQDPNKQVQAFAYWTMQVMADCPIPAHSQIRRHINSALKLAKVDERQLGGSGQGQIPVYSQQDQEGYFINLAAVISQRSSLPAYAHAQVDSVFNEQFHSNDVKLYMMQQEAEQWFDQAQAMSSYMNNAHTRDSRQQDKNRQSMRDIYSALGIKSRRNASSSIGQQQQQFQQQQPFAMIALRTRDVDQAFMALDKRTMLFTIGRNELLKSRKNGDNKPMFARLFEHLQQQHQTSVLIATNLAEQETLIPTACGMPLRLTESAPLLVNIQTGLTIEQPDQGGVKVTIGTKAMASGMHIQKMEAWTPFMVSGVDFLRSMEANIPLNAEIVASMAQGLSMKFKLPEAGTNTKLFGAHSLPFCYTAGVNEKTGLVRQPFHVRAIQNPKLANQQHDTDTVIGAQDFAIPLHIRANYHWPSGRTSFKEFLQILMTTENSIQVRYQPDQDSPREIAFRLSGDPFQQSQEIKQKLQPLNDFYARKFDEAANLEEKDKHKQKDSSHSEGRQKLQNFLRAYQPAKQYKHDLKLSAQTVGGSKEFKFQAGVSANCDDKVQACHFQMDVSRSPLSNEPQEWTLKAQAQLVMPETVNTVEQMAQLRTKNDKFICQAQAQWGAESPKQHIRIRVKAERQVQRSEWHQVQKFGNATQDEQQVEQGIQQQPNRLLERRTAFLNKIDLEAEYNGLKPTTQNVFHKIMEQVKLAYFWNVKCQLRSQHKNISNSANGTWLIWRGEHETRIEIYRTRSRKRKKVLASMIIDPHTHQYANISVQTRSQLVQLQHIQLPIQARPFPLVGHNAQPVQSVGQLIARRSLNGRAECTVDCSRVKTFDDQKYKAPLSTKCYSVVAQDCSSEFPDFVVLMKAVQQNGEGKKAQKKLKVISTDATIECQPKTCASSAGQCFRQQEIECKINGQTVQPATDENNNVAPMVDFNNGQQSDVTVHVPGAILVRFNGHKAWLKVSASYKNGQCGLCGHYNDKTDDEWRMGNNEIASEMSQFHRSYALKMQGSEEEECTQQHLDQFYQQNAKRIRNYHENQRRDDEEDQNDQQDNDNDEEDDEYGQREKFDGTYDDEDFHSEQNANNNNDNSNNINNVKDAFFGPNDDQQQEEDQLEMFGKNNKNRRQLNQSPVEMTKVIELHNAICFSTHPVKQCPRGTVPADRSTGDFDGSNQQQDNNDENVVPFVCMARFSAEARQLLRQSRQSQRVLNVQELVAVSGHSFLEEVREPQSCRRV